MVARLQSFGNEHRFDSEMQGSWETHATVLANAPDDEAVAETYNRITTDLKIDPKIKPRVIFARDTRASGPRFVSALLAALEASGTEHTDYGHLTTPQLHYITRCINTKGSPYEYGEPTEKGYYEKMGSSFKAAMGNRKFNGPITVDCANGIGGPKLQELIKYLPSLAEGGLEIKIVNDDVESTERLNHQVRTSNVETAIKTQMACHSAEQILSKQISVHRPHRTPHHLQDAPRSMEMPTV